MSVWDGWSICDRCSFKYRRRMLHKEATGWVVCDACYDGKYDLVRHPQNRPARPRREMLPVPDGRPMDGPQISALLTDELDFIVTEFGDMIELWTYDPPT